MKKLWTLLITLGLVLQMTACTANKSVDDTELIENADVEKIEADESSFADDSLEVAADGSSESSDDLELDDSLQAALGETKTEQAAPAPTPAAPVEAAPTETAELSLDEATTPQLDETTIPDATVAEAPAPEAPLETITADSVTAAQTEEPLPIIANEPSLSNAETEITASSDETPTTDVANLNPAPVEETYSEPAKPVTAAASTSLQKIAETTPYAHGEGFVNTVYIARPKERLADISQTIFGMDKSKELKQINPYLKSRGARPGDKIYYVSPNRPTDSSKMVSYYEDNGMTASTYVAKKGDRLTKVSKDLLGYSNAWKEVWTTNNIQSKTKLAEGDVIQYWKPAQTSVATQVAANSGANMIDSANQLPAAPPAPAAAAPVEPTMPVAQAELPPQEMAQSTQPTELPPAPPMDAAPGTEVAMNDMPATELPPAPPAQAELPPPPTDELQAAPPAPPAPPETAMATEQAPEQNTVQPNLEEESADPNSDMFTLLGLGALLCGAIAYMLVKRRRNQQAEMSSMSEHNVGT